MAPQLRHNGVDTLLESHEDRLQRVETGIQSCNTSLAECRLELNHLGTSINQGFSTLSEKMDTSHQQQHQLSLELGQLRPRLDKLEGEHKANSRRLSNIKRSALALILAGAGAFAAKGGEYLWTLLK